jgi:hypothetical protein
MIQEPLAAKPTKLKSIEELCAEMEKMKQGLLRFTDNRDVRLFIETGYKERMQILISRGRMNDVAPYKGWLESYNKINPLKYG